MTIESIVTIIAGICAIIAFFGVESIRARAILLLLCMAVVICVNFSNCDETCIFPPETTQITTTSSDNNTESIMVETYTTQMQTQAPQELQIKDATALDDCFYIGTEAEEDVYGNIYDTYIWAVMGGVGVDNEEYEEYMLQQKYTKLVGTLFVSKEESSVNSFVMKVYVDDKEIYKSPVVKKESEPCSVEVDIAGANKVKIEFILIDGISDMTTAMRKEATAYFADCKFINE